METIARIDTPNTKHLYDVQVSRTEYVQVEANNRAQAERIATRAGYSVWSINMIG